MKKRLISLLLVAVLLMSVVPMASAAKSMSNFGKTATYKDGQFTDVKAADWFNAGVKGAFELGLMKGNTETTFKPKGNLTVAEALVIACRLHSIYNDNGAEFVQGSPWYQVYVDYAVANGILKAGQLEPKNAITREQFAYVMCGAIPEAELPAINKVTEIPDEKQASTYGGFVYRLYNAGVLTGNDKYGTFTPKAPIQRSAVATIVTRMADKSQRQQFTLEKQAVTGIQLAGNTSIKVGETTRWTAKALPEGVTAKLTWAAGNPGVATVDKNGKITGIKAGQCNITVSAPNGVKKTVMVTVVASAVTEIQIIGDSGLCVGESTTWEVSLSPDGAQSAITWSSGNPGVATVDQNGKITAHKTGLCNITASAPNGVKKTVMVTVGNRVTIRYPEMNPQAVSTSYFYKAYSIVLPIGWTHKIETKLVEVLNLYEHTEIVEVTTTHIYNASGKKVMDIDISNDEGLRRRDDYSYLDEIHGSRCAGPISYAKCSDGTWLAEVQSEIWSDFQLCGHNVWIDSSVSPSEFLSILGSIRHSL